ncbi:MAG: hypothetical protein F4X65_10930 [Chloroflexi bacterium]|nr:hypothetical protein [Chloroflexota bacterium]
MGEERSGISGHAVSQRAGGGCVAMAGVRSFVVKRPERVESAAWLLLLPGSYAAVMMGRSGLMFNLNRSVKGERSFQPLRRLVR